jgi:hypothetical protein
MLFKCTTFLDILIKYYFNEIRIKKNPLYGQIDEYVIPHPNGYSLYRSYA